MIEEPARSRELDRAMNVLSDRHRRRTLALLGRTDPRANVEIAPERIVPDDEDSETCKRLLHHVHFPKLDAAGYVVWDRERGVVRRGPRFDEIEPYVEWLLAREDERRDVCSNGR